MERLVPYSLDVFQAIVAEHNLAHWPMHLVAAGLFWGIIACARRGDKANGWVVSMILAAFWVWPAWVYLLGPFAALNWAGVYFGYAFIAQGLLVGIWGGLFGNLTFSLSGDRRTLLGVLFMTLALLGHGIITLSMNILPTSIQSVGVMPTPSVLLFIGALMLADRKPPAWLFVIPVMWLLWDGSAAWVLQSIPDMAMVGVTALALLIILAWRWPPEALPDADG